MQKYGGTSLADLDRIRHVAQHIAQTKQNHDLVVVVSAMGQQTDELLAMAYELAPHPVERELDMLLTVGERISMALLSIALNAHGISTVSLTGSQSGIITDTYHGNARIQDIQGHRIQQALDQHKVVIIAGFQGMSLPNKEVTTLGRGGSDLTAIALTQRLKATRCEIYKDVDGIYTADPRLVQAAHPLKSLGWSALTHLTWFGSSVVHSRGAHLAQKGRIPLEIRSSFDLEKPGTRVEQEADMEAAHIEAMSHREGLALVQTSHAATPALHQLTSWLWRLGITPLINQEVKTSDGRWQCRLAVPSQNLKDLQAMVQQSSTKTSDFAVLHPDVAAITLVGAGFWQAPEILDQAMQALVSQPLLIATQNQTITFLVEGSSLQADLVNLHQQLIVDTPGN